MGIGLDLLLDLGLQVLVGHVRLLQAQHHRIELHEFDAEHEVHLERGREFARHFVVVAALHADVHLVQHEQIGLLEERDLFAECRQGVGSRLGVLCRLRREGFRIGQGETHKVEVLAALDIPHERAEHRPQRLHYGTRRLDAGLTGVCAGNRGIQNLAELALERRLQRGLGGKPDKFRERKEVGLRLAAQRGNRGRKEEAEPDEARRFAPIC